MNCFKSWKKGEQPNVSKTAFLLSPLDLTHRVGFIEIKVLWYLWPESKISLLRLWLFVPCIDLVILQRRAESGTHIIYWWCNTFCFFLHILPYPYPSVLLTLFLRPDSWQQSAFGRASWLSDKLSVLRSSNTTVPCSFAAYYEFATCLFANRLSIDTIWEADNHHNWYKTRICKWIICKIVSRVTLASSCNACFMLEPCKFLK